MPLLPTEFLDGVVAIGVGSDPATRQWIATGFLYGVPIKKKDEEGNPFYGIFMISNKHVFKDRTRIWVKLNAADGSPSKDYRVDLIAKNGKPVWAGHPDDNVDIAALSINVQKFQEDERRLFYFNEDLHALTADKLAATSIAEGDGVFILGFPLRIVDRERQYVICRSGAIARISDVRNGHGREVLVDGLVFPGNSGGPVITRPELASVGDQEPHRAASLLGIVASYIPYQEIAISEQTRRPRTIFEENSGLMSVFPAELVKETVALARSRLQSRLAQRKYQAKRKKAVEEKAGG